MEESELAIFDVGNGYYFCATGRWTGWMFRKHPDGQFVSSHKARQLIVEQDLSRLILREKEPSK